MRDESLLEILHDTATAVRRELDGLARWELAGTRPGQYTHDLVSDDVAVATLVAAGLGVLSEESGHHHPQRDIVVVVDPVDGSTNAAHGLPWWATSLCAVDGDGPRVAVVVNQVTAVRYEAVRGGGARVNGAAITPSTCTDMEHAIVALSGHADRHLGWEQYRALGAAALDLCSVAAGSLDAYIDCGTAALAPWDYLGALLVCREAGAFVADLDGRELVVRDHDARRKVVAAGTEVLLAEALEARRSLH